MLSYQQMPLLEHDGTFVGMKRMSASSNTIDPLYVTGYVLMDSNNSVISTNSGGLARINDGPTHSAYYSITFGVFAKEYKLYLNGILSNTTTTNYTNLNFF